MAESNQRKIADLIELNDDDPFAELTRIMGFDPRVGIPSKLKAADLSAPAATVTPRPVMAPIVAQPAAVQPTPVAAADHDDFGIDLEKELMGEFADFEAAPAAAPAAAAASQPHWAAPQPYVASEPYAAPADADLDGEFHDAFAASFEEGMPAVESAEQPSLVEPEVARPYTGSYESAAGTDALEPELDLDPEFDLDLAAAPEFGLDPEFELDLAREPEPAFAPAPGLDAAAAPDLDLDREFELDLAREPESAFAPAPGLDAAAAPDLEFDPEFELDLAPEPESVFAPAPGLDAAAAPDLDLDPEFELDLAPEPDADLAAAPGSELAVEPDLGIVPEFELDDIDFSEPLEDANPVEAAAPRFHDAPAYNDELPAYADEVLDEASAQDLLDLKEAPATRDALAEVDMDFTGAFERGMETEHGANGTPDSTPPADLWAVEPEHQVERVLQPDASDPHAFSLEDELDALLNARPEPVHQAPATVVAPEPAWQSAHPADARWAALEDEQAEVVQEVAAPAAPSIAAPEPRRPFINPALISRHANFKVAAPTVAAPANVVQEPQDDLDDLLAAMESQVHSGDHSPASAEAAPAYDLLATEAAGTGHDHADSEPAVAERTNTVPAYAGHDDEAPARSAYDAAPDIETIDVPETAVAMADDLDIPELAYEEDEPAGQAFDDIDAEFAAAYGETSPSDELASQPVRGGGRTAADFESLYRPSVAYPAPSALSAAAVDGNAAAATAAAELDDGAPFDNFEIEAAKTPLAGDRDRFVDLDFDSDVDEEMTVPAHAQQERVAPRQRRGMMIAAIVGVVALLGGVGALALSLGKGEGTDVPVLVKADDGPVKIKPENPGGTTVPNQDNKVYDAVKGTSSTSTAPAQERLVTTSEEPVDMAAVDKADTTELPGLADEEDIIPKADDRVDPLAGDQSMNAPEGVIVTPRKVKTMVVRSDGTLVAREDPTSAAPVEPAIAGTAADAAPLQPTEQPSAGGDETAAVATDPVTTDKTAADNKLKPAFQSPGAEEAVALKPVKTKKVEGTVVPEAGPVVLARPAEQPAEAVGEVKPEQLASANVEPAAIASGAWSVQIASQPSQESANANYQDLSRRYASVIGGRGVNIVKAEITGKGTYWRVRVPAKSRDEAINLCNEYKAAGGNCFVSK